ncbi:MAG: hypothetical protein ACYC0F_00270 [Rhodanobacter sp.]
METEQTSDEAAKAMFAYDITQIQTSPLGQTHKGKEIVKLLRRLNDAGKIRYGGTLEGDRADWDGSFIRISSDFSGNIIKTIGELVHEAVHALARLKLPRKHKQSSAEIQKEEENAKRTQAEMYLWLKSRFKGMQEDPEMEKRLRKFGMVKY